MDMGIEQRQRFCALADMIAIGDGALGQEQEGDSGPEQQTGRFHVSVLPLAHCA